MVLTLAVAVACGETTGPTPDVISAAHSTVTVAPGTPVTAGGTATVAVQLRNTEGGAIRVNDAAVQVAASAGTVGPVTSAGDGRYTATVTTTVAGTVTVTATVNGQAIPGSTAIVFVAGPAANITKVSGDLQTGVVGTALAVAPSVRVTDTFGNAVAGSTVTFAAPAGSGTPSPATASTGASGVAAVNGWVLGSTAGTHSLTATVPGLPVVTFAATATAGAPAELVKTAGDMQSADAGSNVAVPPALVVRDAFGNPRGGIAVTFAVTAGGGSLVAASATSGPDGSIALLRWTLGTTAGTNTITASAAGVPTVTFTAQGRAGAASSITKAGGDAQSGVAGDAVAVAPSVRVADVHGNPVPGVMMQWRVTGGNGTVASTSTSDVSGIATSPTWTLGATVGTNTLSAFANGIVGVSFTATGTPGAAATLTRIAGDAQSAVAGSAVATAPQVRVTDSRGNAVPSAIVTFVVASGDGGVTGASATAGADGVAALASWTLGRTAGANTLTATSGSASTTFTATGVAGDVATMTIAKGEGQGATVGTTAAESPAVLLKDANGNPVAGQVVTFAVVNGGGSLDATSGSSDASGVATAGRWTYGTTAGPNTVRATLGTLSAQITGTASAGAAADIARIAGDAQSAPVTTTLVTPAAVRIADSFGNPVAGAAVTFTVASGGGSVSGGSVATDASGIATVGSWSLGSAAGINTLIATSRSLSTTFTATATAGAAASLARSAGDGQSAVAGTAVAVAPSVSLRDAQNNPVAGATVTFAVTSGNGSVTGASAVTDASGVATAGSWTLGAAAGMNTLTASSGGLQVSFTATGLVGPAAVMQQGQGDGQSAVAGTTVAIAPSVLITDARGNPVAGASVTFAASGGGSITGSPATTGADGIAALTSWTLGGTAGPNSLTATAGSLVVTFSATGTAGAATTIAKTAGDAQTATVGTSVATAPAVRVTDQYGNAVAGASVAFAAGSGGSVAGSPAVSDASGIATLGSWTLGTTPGAQSLTATTGSASVTFAVTATAGAAANIQKTAGDGQAATAGTAVAVAPSVTISDALGNPVAGVTVTFAVTSGGGGLTGATSTTDASGIATLGSWTLGTSAGTQGISATAGSLSTTFAATATAGSPAVLTIVSGDGQSATVGTAVGGAPRVAVVDANGNPVAGVAVTFSVSGGGGSITGATATTDALGQASVGSWQLGTAVGANSLDALAGALGATFTATGTAAAASSLVIVAGDAQSATAGTAVTVSPQVRITDTYGNPIAGRAVTFAVGSGGGSVSGASTTTDASGFATLGGWTLGATAGANTLTASSAGLTTVTFTATATAPPPALIEIVQGDAQTASAGSAVATLPRVRVKDAGGNVLAGVTVNFAVAGGNGSITGATATTDAGGLATVGSWTLGSGGAGCSAFAVTNCSRNALTASAATGSATPVSFKAYVPPVAYSGSYQTVGNATVSVPAANGLLFGALSINGDGPNGTGATLSLVGGTTPPGTTITRSADGSFTVLTRSVGTVSYSYAVSDGIASTNTSVTAAIVASNIVWYVQQGATATGADGSDANPYNSLATLETALGTRTNDVILVKNASNTNIPGGTLKSGQTLYGQFASSPYTYTTGSSATYRNGNQTLTLLTNGGLTLMDRLVLSTGNTITGINVQNATGTGITGIGFGTLTVNRVSVNSAGGALDLSTGTLVGTFTDVNSAGGGYGVSLNDVATSGTVDLGGGNLQGATTSAFRVIGAGTPSQNLHNLTYSGAMSHTGAGKVIDIQNHAGGALTLSGNVFCSSSCQGMQVTGGTGGSVTLSGSSKTFYAAYSFAPVSLTNNTFTTVSFTNGGLSVSGNTASGFYASNNGGAVTVTGANNTFSGSSSLALEVLSTPIGAAGITAQSISASGGINGISLNQTGSLGSLTVTGNGGTCTSAASCTGGAIQTTSGNGIYLNGTLAPSFSRMYVAGTRVHGVSATGVNGLSVTNSVITNSGMTTAGAVNGTGTENNIDIVDASGTYAITGNTLANGLNHGVRVASGNSTLPSLTISGNTFTSGTTTTLSKGNAVHIAMTSSGSFSGNVIAGAISNNTITGFPSGKGISITATNANATGMAGVGIPSGGTTIASYAGPQVFTVSDNQIAGISAANRMGSNAIYLTATGRAQSNVSITGNGTSAAPVQNMAGSAIYLSAAGTIANVYANVANNYLSPNGVSGGGIEAYSTQSTAATDNPLLSLVATGNAITNSVDNGIRLAANQAVGRLFARVENNTIAAPTGIVAPNYGIYALSSSTGASNVCLRIRSNTTAGSAVGGTTYPGIGLARSATGTFGIDGLTPSPAATPTVENYVNSLNTSASGSAGIGVGGTELRTTTTGYTSCTSAP